MADIDVSFYPKAEGGNRLLETAGAAIGLQTGATQAQQAKMDLVKGQTDYLVNGFSSLASKADLNPQDFYAFGQRAVEQGILSPDVFDAEMKAIGNVGSDQKALRALATNYGLRALDAGQRFAAQFGSPQMVQTGNNLLPVTASPLTGIHPIGAPIQMTLSPSERASPTQIGVTPEGQPIVGTTGQMLERAGVNPLTALPAPAPLNPLTMQQQSTGAVPGGGLVTTLPAGAVPAMEEAGRAAGVAYAQDQARERTFQQSITPLAKAITSLEALGKTGTGPGTEQINEIQSFLQSIGIPVADTEKIKNFDEARKYLTQYARDAGDTNTNDKLAAAFAGNPSVGISNAAATDVAKTALALRRLQNAQVRAFSGSEDKYPAFASQFNASQDPRAYGFDLMTPQAREKLIKSLSGAEKTRFIQSLRTAVDLGLVSPPGAPNG